MHLTSTSIQVSYSQTYSLWNWEYLVINSLSMAELLFLLRKKLGALRSTTISPTTFIGTKFHTLNICRHIWDSNRVAASKYFKYLKFCRDCHPQFEYFLLVACYKSWQRNLYLRSCYTVFIFLQLLLNQTTVSPTIASKHVHKLS